MKKYFLFATLSGCAWAAIAYLLSLGVFPARVVFGGLVVSPVIGLFIGWMFLPAYKLPKFVQFALSLVTLYIAVALFGFAVGISDAARAIPNRGTFEVILQAVIACIMGVTMGYVLILWPLAYLNHRLLVRTYNDPDNKSLDAIGGIKVFVDDNSGKAKRGIVQVKSGHVKSGDIRDLVGTLDREGAAFATVTPEVIEPEDE